MSQTRRVEDLLFSSQPSVTDPDHRSKSRAANCYMFNINYCCFELSLGWLSVQYDTILTS